MQRLVEMVGAPDQERLCVVAAQDRYLIGADRSCLQLRLTQVVRAQENGVDRGVLSSVPDRVPQLRCLRPVAACWAECVLLRDPAA